MRVAVDYHVDLTLESLKAGDPANAAISTRVDHLDVLIEKHLAELNLLFGREASHALLQGEEALCGVGLSCRFSLRRFELGFELCSEILSRSCLRSLRWVLVEKGPDDR